jgi:hypothetical protein
VFITEDTYNRILIVKVDTTNGSIILQQTSSDIKGSFDRISVEIAPTSDAVFFSALSSDAKDYLCRWQESHANNNV